MTKAKFKLKVYSERCKDCGICFEFCPKNNLKPGEDGTPEMIDYEACTGCKLCEYLCPDFAIQVWKDEEEERKEKASE